MYILWYSMAQDSKTYAAVLNLVSREFEDLIFADIGPNSALDFEDRHQNSGHWNDLYGLSACTENVKYSLHTPNDIIYTLTFNNRQVLVLCIQTSGKVLQMSDKKMKNMPKTFITRTVLLTKKYLSTHSVSNFVSDPVTKNPTHSSVS